MHPNPASVSALPVLAASLVQRALWWKWKCQDGEHRASRGSDEDRTCLTVGWSGHKQGPGGEKTQPSTAGGQRAARGPSGNGFQAELSGSPSAEVAM